MKQILLLKQVYERFSKDQGFFMAASISFYALFSIFPLLLFIISVLGFVLESAALQREILEQVFSNLPGIGKFVQANLQAIVAKRGTIGALGLLGLLWSGLGVFDAIENALNRIWRAPASRIPIRAKLIALLILLWLAILLLISLIVTSGATTLGIWFSLLFPDLAELLTPLWRLVPAFLGILLSISLFFVVYKFVPHLKLRLKQVWLGALTAGLGWEGAKHLFVWYLKNFASYGKVYGSLGTVIALMFWIYISSIILLLGAELNSVYLKSETTGKQG